MLRNAAALRSAADSQRQSMLLALWKPEPGLRVGSEVSGSMLRTRCPRRAPSCIVARPTAPQAAVLETLRAQIQDTREIQYSYDYWRESHS